MNTDTFNISNEAATALLESLFQPRISPVVNGTEPGWAQASAAEIAASTRNADMFPTSETLTFHSYVGGYEFVRKDLDEARLREQGVKNLLEEAEYQIEKFLDDCHEELHRAISKMLGRTCLEFGLIDMTTPFRRVDVKWLASMWVFQYLLQLKPEAPIEDEQLRQGMLKWISDQAA
jgi:hypothetical protein